VVAPEKTSPSSNDIRQRSSLLPNHMRASRWTHGHSALWRRDRRHHHASFGIRARRQRRLAGATLGGRVCGCRRRSRRRTAGGRAQGSARSAVHDRLRRRRHASRVVERRRGEPAARGAAGSAVPALVPAGGGAHRGAVGPILPAPTVPIARALREMVGHLIVDARPDKLGPR
jgi:hypothetical protein